MVKRDPRTGEVISDMPASNYTEVCEAIEKAKAAQPAWAKTPPVERGEILYAICEEMRQHQNELVSSITLDTGKSEEDAWHELKSAILLGRFFAGEGQRLYGVTTTSAIRDRWAMTLRQPCGVAGLITAFNMPIANVAWKVFPALICGNAVVLKPSEDAPMTAAYFAEIVKRYLPEGVFHILQGDVKTGEAIVFHHDIDLISFTGSTAVGTVIGKECASRNVKCSLEMGGKNAFVVCDDAVFSHAIEWAIRSAFSLAGQRCASASRIVVFNNIYDRFKDALVAAMPRTIQPVINEAQLANMLNVIAHEVDHGAQIIAGGHRMKDELHKNGYYMAPTLLENSTVEIARTDLFGPIATLHRANDLAEALRIVNDSSYGLTACIHTQNLDRALQFVQNVQTGVVSVNAGTFGSEPHMPFGGLKQSGNGTREPGVEALDVYSQLKTVYFNSKPIEIG